MKQAQPVNAWWVYTVASTLKRRPIGRLRQLLAVTMAGLVVALVGSVYSPTAAGAPGDVGVQGPSFTGVTAPTGEKPESKLWFNDGRWWASMFAVASGRWHIFYLDRGASPKTWVDTGTVVDDRANSLSDALWTGTKLYVASHIKATSNTNATAGLPSRLYRFSYDSGSKTYTVDTGFPVVINNTSSETLTLDRDSTGRLWATWTQQKKVYVNATTTGDQWGTPFVLPINNTTVDADDISTLVRFGSRIGVLWSSQSDSAVYFSSHASSDPVTTWTATHAVTVPGSGEADDHLNIKELQADPDGRIFAVIKTSLENTGATAPMIIVLARSPSGGWSRATFGTVADCHTRPTLMLDTTNNLVRVYATAPDSGCPFSGTAGSIFEKTSPMDALAFTPGRGTPVMRDAASPNLNNVSSSKQPVDAGSGVVLLSGNDVTKRYWFSDQSLQPMPGAEFSADPTSGLAPLAVQFTDASTGSPSSWSWDFGDGSTSTAQLPHHVYDTPGTYTVSLTVTNASGTDTRTRNGLVVAGRAGAGIVAGESTSTHAATAVSAVTLDRPAGTVVGDVLVATISADLNPSVTQVPTGWTAMVNGLSVNSSGSSGARLYSYYKVVTSSEPASYTWSLSAARKWGGGVTAYRGVDTATPLDSSVVTAVNTTYTATALTLPSITTASGGAMLVGGLALDSANPAVSAPSGWVEQWESAGGQVAEHASGTQAEAGATGPATWTLSGTRAVGGWRAALRPAS